MSLFSVPTLAVRKEHTVGRWVCDAISSMRTLSKNLGGTVSLRRENGSQILMSEDSLQRNFCWVDQKQNVLCIPPYLA